MVMVRFSNRLLCTETSWQKKITLFSCPKNVLNIYNYVIPVGKDLILIQMLCVAVGHL